MRRPPRSTLFPTRRSSDLDPPLGPARLCSGPPHDPAGQSRDRRGRREIAPQDREVRSEEHTSELQSRQYLVCRLLLEKKKKSHELGLVVPVSRLLRGRKTA